MTGLFRVLPSHEGSPGQGVRASRFPGIDRSPLVVCLVSLLGLAVPSPSVAQESLRERLASLPVPELRFTAPEPRAEEVDGVPVFFLEDRDLPLVTVYAAFRGGYARLPRRYLGAATALPALLRTGGTRGISPDTVDARVEFYALSLSFGQAGGGMASTMNVLEENLEPAADLWSKMLQAPAFDSAQVEVWRGRELERVLRRRDDLASMAYSRFNRIMFGDHPVGWEMGPEDLEPDDLSPENLRAVHEAIVCPDNLVLGVVGDLDWAGARGLAERIVGALPDCSGLLGEEPEPELRVDPGVFVIHRDVEQAVVVMAHSTGLRQDDSPAYFASRIGNSILGSSGLSSRLSRRIRTREGLAYGASSLWTASAKRDGLMGAITRTKPETAVEAAELILEEMDSMAAAPPDPAEVGRAIDEIVNGFVFNFETPFQIVARAIAFRNQDLPEDWLERYVAGVQDVTGRSVRDAFREHLDTDRMTLLLVGDTTRFSRPASSLGPVTVLEDLPSSQRGSPQSRP